ncbi:LysR substrate-binding domain-containing protein [Stappia sp. 28M-7]|uniref:LysR substrate-binding domain-containing protein n=1 Tax=Stappia sp. 28M-7 TaxID=2762596 RepID=UPI00163C2765|nr:LysR substrate-binding domain-containing protein [Stappia sp. 28M-7]MBC2858499.1 LysR family transcriptional regulator [Stappia sp. 28M-7]
MIKANLDMDALRSMVAGIELGSFARAASVLGRSQSAISMHLKKLEQQTGQVLFRRSGRGLVPTEAGETLLAHARRILALNDAALDRLGAAAAPAAIRLGLPQDFFEDVMPATLQAFAGGHPGTHVEVRAGRNHTLAQEVHAGRLDAALAFFPQGPEGHGEKIATLPLVWIGTDTSRETKDPLPLVLFDHPCLFRQTALRGLDQAGRPWRLALTTPSLPGLWAAMRTGHGITARTRHRIPADLREIDRLAQGLPDLPPIEVRLLSAEAPSPAAAQLCTILRETAERHIAGHESP